MRLQTAWAVCLVVSQAAAQYGPPPSKTKKHRTTTTTTEAPGALSNDIAGPFPLPDTYSYAGSAATAQSGGPGGPSANSFWWAGPDSPFKPGAQPSGGPPPPAPPPYGGPPQTAPPAYGGPPQTAPPAFGGPPQTAPPPCGGPAGCSGVGTDPRPSPSEPAPRPVDISQNPFLSSAILGKPIQQSPQGCQSPGGGCQNPPSYPGAPGSGSGFPQQPAGQYPQAIGTSQYPGQPKPTAPNQYPVSQPTGPNQYPASQPTGPNQYPASQPTGPNQYPASQPTGPNQYPVSQPTGPNQYPSSQPTGPNQYPASQPSGINQYPGQPKPTGPSQFPGQQPVNQYPGQPKPTTPNQYPGQQQPLGQYPGSQPTGNNQYPTGPSQYPGQLPVGQYPGQPKPTGSSLYPGQPQPTGQYLGPQATGPNQYPIQPRPTGPSLPQTTGQYLGPQATGPNQYPSQPRPTVPAVPLRPQCGLAGHACVPSSACVGGVISPSGVRQMRDPQVKECIPGLEACCRIPSQANVPYTQTPQYPATSQRPYTGPLNTTPYPGCAAALKCVAENYCTADGVMSDTPVVLTREQAENKVPTTDCQDLETGLVGKCCRDPNYKDPWPAGMMMMKNPGDFDDGQYHGEGSGPGVNIGPAYNSISPTPLTPAKDHGPKPSIAAGGFNKPFPPPFPGNTPQPGPPNQPNQPSGTPYQPGQPSTPTGYQPNQPSQVPQQPNQLSPNSPGSYQPGKPFGNPNQPDKPSIVGVQPTQPATYQPNQPTGTPYQPNQPSISPYQPPYPPGQSTPVGSPSQPIQPSETYQPGQPTQPDFPGQETEYTLPTHPGQNQASEPKPQDQGPAPGSSCGVRRPGPEGDVAGFAEFPWQALVVSAGNRSLLCGAAIIADNAVVTAAHCVNQLRAKDILVKGGEWKLLGQNPKPVQVRPVASIARHPGFDSGSLAKDLAILVVAEPFTFDTHIDKICVPPELGSEYFQKPGQNCVITGWGKNALQGPIQDSELHKVDVNVIPAKQCEAKLKTSQNLGKYFILNEGFSCALPPSPTDLCKVDFGSAVACERGDGHYELAGVNSWDIACPTGQSLPSVFATSDAQWINLVLNTPLPVLQAEEGSYNQALSKGEDLGGVDVDDKPGFSQGYGK